MRPRSAWLWPSSEWRLAPMARPAAELATASRNGCVLDRAAGDLAVHRGAALSEQLPLLAAPCLITLLALLRDASDGAVSARVAGVSTDAPDAGAHCSRLCVLSRPGFSSPGGRSRSSSRPCTRRRRSISGLTSRSCSTPASIKSTRWRRSGPARPRPPRRADDQAEAAFEVWRSTALADYPVTSSVELFNAQGKLVSRYAFNLPDDQLTPPPVSEESSCGWAIVGEIESVLRREPAHPSRRAPVVWAHAGRRRLGSIVVRAMHGGLREPAVHPLQKPVRRPGASGGSASRRGRRRPRRRVSPSTAGAARRSTPRAARRGRCRSTSSIAWRRHADPSGLSCGGDRAGSTSTC